MEKIDEVPNIKENFKIENLCVQCVYQAKEKYNVIYINSKLYAEIFKEKYGVTPNEYRRTHRG